MFSILRQRATASLAKNARKSSGLSQEQVDKTYNLMKKISLFGVPLVVALGAWNAYSIEAEHHTHPRKEYIAYPYLNIYNRTWPWGNGKHSLFHNPKTNYVRGVGYEEDWYTK